MANVIGNEVPKKLRETGGPTVLTIGTIADGEFLKRTGATVVSGVPSGALDINGLTAADPALGDEAPIYDISAAANRKITIEKLGFLLTGLVGGRLTTESGVPVSTSDRTAQGTLYFTPYLHDKIAIYDGTRWNMYTFTERSLALVVTSDKNYDVFLYDNAGTLTLELSAAWTNDTTRADALTTQDGVYVKSGAKTRRWLGTIRASAANVTEDSLAKRFVWNLYNPVSRIMRAIETTNSWNYTVSDYRQANGSTANQIEYVVGLGGVIVTARVWGSAKNTSAAKLGVGVGLDSTTVNSAEIMVYVSISDPGASTAQYSGYPGIGYHYLAWLEISGGTGTTTWYGDNGVAYVQSGITGEVLG